MKKARILLLLAVVTVLAVWSYACSVMYSGCSNDDDCPQGEVCRKDTPGSKGECGLPAGECVPGETKACTEGRGLCAEEGRVNECLASGVWAGCGRGRLTCSAGCVLSDDACQGTDCRLGEGRCLDEESGEACAANSLSLLDDTCDGVDNNCSGQVDEHVDGIGVECSDGIGECLARGRIICTAAGAMVCSASANPPGPPLCDCRDNNCNGAIDDLAISLKPVLDTDNVVSRPWALGSLGGRVFAAQVFEDTSTAPAQLRIRLLEIVDGEEGPVAMQQGSTFVGRDPRLIHVPASPAIGQREMLYVTYVREAEVPNYALFFDEVHYRMMVLVDQGDGSVELEVGPEVCASCAESTSIGGRTCTTDEECEPGSYGFYCAVNGICAQGRLMLGPVLQYDAVYGFCSSSSGDGDQCNDGRDNDGDTLVDAEDGGCAPNPDGSPSTSEASCAIVFSYIRERTSWSGLRVYTKNGAVHTTSRSGGNSVGSVFGLDQPLGHKTLRMASAGAGIFYAATIVAQPSGTLHDLRVFPVQSTLRPQAGKPQTVIGNVPVDLPHDIVLTSQLQVSVAWFKDDRFHIQQYRASGDELVLRKPGVMTELQVMNGEVSWLSLHPLCAERVMMAYERISPEDGSRTVHVGHINLTEERASYIPTEPGAGLTGSVPMVSHLPGVSTLWGAYVPRVEGIPMLTATPAQLSFAPLLCDF